MPDKNVFWNKAGAAGLEIGSIPVIFLAITIALGKATENGDIQGWLTNVATAILWLAKLFGCAYLLWLSMKKYSASDNGIDKSGILRFGVTASVLSALILSAAQLATILFIIPDDFAQSINAAIEQMSSSLNADARRQLKDMADSMPTIYFFTTFIYCSLYGSVLASIFSRTIANDKQ